MRTRLVSTIAVGAAAILLARSLRRLHTERFDGRVILITGGSRGLGFALAMEFLHRGAHVAIMARDPDALERAMRRLAAEGATVLPLQGDVRRPQDASVAVEQVLERYGRIDVLVNNAGTIAVGPMESMARADYEDAMNTHFWGTYNMVEAVWPSMRRERRGSIVNVASIGGRVSVPHLLPYSASKFAQVGYSEGLRAEAARFGIRVTTVTPGLMRTGSPRNAWFKGNNKAEYLWFQLSDSLPLLSVPASYAARRIANACARGEANVTIGPLAFSATRVQGFSPGLTARAMEIAAALLPDAPGPTGRYRGDRSETGITESPLTFLGRKAERDFNQHS